MSWFVGLWPILVQQGVFVVGIAACLALAFFAEALAVGPLALLKPFTAKIRNIALIVAAGIALSMFWYAKGVSDDAARCKLQFDAAEANAVTRGTGARGRAARDAAGGVRDNQDTDE